MADQLSSSAKQVVAQRRRTFAAREFDLIGGLRDEVAQYFETFQQELDRYFQQFFVRPYPRLADVGEPAWRAIPAAQLGTVPVLGEQFTAGLIGLRDEVTDTLDDELVDAYDDGYEEGLWALFLAGVDEVLDADVAGSADEIEAALLASTVGGLTYRDRVGAWIGTGLAQFDTALRSGIATEGSYADTVGALSQIGRTVRQGIEGLAANELFVAMALGAAAAYGRYGGGQEVWVTMEDEKVCPICFPLHLQVTSLQPVRDTHPACRCEKLPAALVAGRARTYVPFSRFQTRRV